MHSRKQWSLGTGVKVLRIMRTEADSWIVHAVMGDRGICPTCGKRSRNRQGRRDRRFQDLPVHGEAVMFHLRLSRWRCVSKDCLRQTFSDQSPTVAVPYARRTSRMAEIASLLGHSTGGRPGERLMRRLGMPVRDDSSGMLLSIYPSPGSLALMTGVGGDRRYMEP